jgi:DNA-binding ferritin-like protein
MSGAPDFLSPQISPHSPNTTKPAVSDTSETADRRSHFIRDVHSTAPNQSVREMIEEADANLLVVIKDLRDAARVADESNDPGTVDLFSKIVQIHEKHEWFLREVLKRKDGLLA